MKRSIERIRNFLKEENGATAIEYSLIAALISVVMIPAVILVGQSVLATFTAVDAAM